MRIHVASTAAVATHGDEEAFPLYEVCPESLLSPFTIAFLSCNSTDGKAIWTKQTPVRMRTGIADTLTSRPSYDRWMK